MNTHFHISFLLKSDMHFATNFGHFAGLCVDLRQGRLSSASAQGSHNIFVSSMITTVAVDPQQTVFEIPRLVRCADVHERIRLFTAPSRKLVVSAQVQVELLHVKVRSVSMLLTVDLGRSDDLRKTKCSSSCNIYCVGAPRETHK